jgi:hypothetical protein
MRKKPDTQSHDASGTPAALTVEPAFVLLFSIHLKSAFKGFGTLPPGIAPLPPEQSGDYVARLAEFETRLLGKTFREAGRLARAPLGRIALDGLPKGAPTHADVYLLAHKSGVALWEVWLPAPTQPFDAARWIGWLDAETGDGLIAQLWRVLGPVNKEIAGKPAWSGLYFPITLLRAPQHTLETLVERHGTELVHLLFLDHSRRAFKPELVADELARDYCAREGGMTLLARRSGLDVHGREDSAEEVSPAGVPPRSALPFLITLELLLIERAVLAHLYQRLSHRMPGSVEELLTLKQEVLDGLEEYYGAITSATRFSDEVTADGERLLGLGDLYDAVMDRLDTVSFAITTRYQKRMTLMQFWLTVVFGATEIGFIASGIATWYYRAELWTVLAWTVGATLVSGLILVLLLRGKLE